MDRDIGAGDGLWIFWPAPLGFAYRGPMLRTLLRLLPAVAIVGLATALFVAGAGSDLSLAGLSAHAQEWRAAAGRDPVRSLALYVATYAILTSAGMPVAMGLTIAGGVIFGAIEGGAAALGAASLAALIGYAMARSALGPLAARWIDRQGGHVALFAERMRTEGFVTILTGRLLPVMPFPLVNFASGLARVPVRSFMAATVLGGLPASFTYATLGAGVGQDFTAEGLSQAIRSPMVWGPLLLLSAVSAVPLVLRWRRGRSARDSSVI